MKYEKMCNEILPLVGGRENISDCFNCMTRLRIVVDDLDKVDREGLKKVQGIMGINVVGNQVQCIIGQNAETVCAEFCELNHLTKKATISDPDAEKADKKTEKGFKGVINAMVDAMSNCIQPILQLMITGGMIKFLYTLLGPVMLGVISEESELYRILYIVGEASMYFTPIYLGYTAAKYFNVSVGLGMLMGGIMCYPDLVAIGSGSVESFHVFGIPMTLTTYTSSFIPIILCVWIMSYIERFLKKIVPDMLKMMLVGTLTILIMLPIGLCVVGPLGNIIGNAISNAFVSLPSILGPVGLAIICILYPILIIFGIHVPVAMASLPAFFANGYDQTIWIADALQHYSCYGICLAYMLKAKTKEDRALGASSFVSAALGGVVEPAMYGIEIPNRILLVIQLLATGVAGLVGGIFGLKFYIYGSTTFLCFLDFVGPGMNLVVGIACCIIAFVCAFAGAFLFGKIGKKEA